MDNTTRRIKAIDESISFSQAKKVIFWGGIATGTYLIGRSIYRGIQKNRIASALQTDENARYALIIHSALYGGWFGWTVDETTLYDTASRITNWDKVQEYYSKLTGKNLAEVLANRLSATENTRFTSLLASGGTSPGQTMPSVTPNPGTGKIAVATMDVDVRSSPVRNLYTLNKIGVAKAGQIIGRTTGKEFFYEGSWYAIFENDVMFSEITGKRNGQQANVYAWKGALEFLTEAQAVARFGANWANQSIALNGFANPYTASTNQYTASI